MSLIKINNDKLAELRSKEVDALRRKAYEEEADPLFFKYQRGEVTKDEWLNKIAEIKSRIFN
jgi:hypothetical protein